jgi:phage terminase large subunit
MLIKTTAQTKIAKLKKRIRIVQGGTSSSKTFTILPFLIQYAVQTSNSEISVVSESIPHLKRGALKDFLKIMDWTNNFNPNNFNKSNLTYKFANGSYIEFFSADQPDKLRGARRDILFINECNNVAFESYQQLSIRTKKFIYLDYNPTNEFWVHTELIDTEDTDFVILTYKDNEALDPAIVNEIEKAKAKAETSTYWDNWWKVYGLGQIGTLDGVIFNNWQQIDTIPTEARLIGYGLDFGYTNDPTAIVEVYKWNDKRILNEICYQKELSNSQIAKYITTKLPCYCDSAEPKSIAELSKLGVNAYGVSKGADSVNFGIQLIQENEYLVSKNSTNLINEFRKYAWDKDKRTGEKLNKPIDNFNHCFTEDTMITTINGLIKIKDIKEGDLVLTSKGYKKVLKTFNNGIKKVNKYSMQLDTFFVFLCSTKEHEIKTKKGWKKISQLQKMDKLFLCNVLTEKNINYIQTKNILVEEQKNYIQKLGNILKGKFQKDTMFIMLMAILLIMIYQTLIWLMEIYILSLKVKNDLKKILNGLKNFILKVLKVQKNGISQKKEKNGIVNMEKKLGLIENIKNKIAKFVEKNMKQDMQELQNIVIQTAKLKHYEKGESYEAVVYDLMVEDVHEYFANGILVHNCIDAFRYHEMETNLRNKTLTKTKFG